MIFKFLLIHIADWSPRKWADATSKKYLGMVCQVVQRYGRWCSGADPAFQNVFVQSHWRILLAEFKFANSPPRVGVHGLAYGLIDLFLTYISCFTFSFPKSWCLQCVGNTTRCLKSFDIGITPVNTHLQATSTAKYVNWNDHQTQLLIESLGDFAI